MACCLDRCGAFRRPTAMSTLRAVHFGTQTPAAYDSVACSSGREVHFPYRCSTLRRPTAISTQQAVHFGTQTPAAGFAPPTRHARPLIFSPHATHRRLISSYKFLLSPPLFPVAAPIALRSARSAIVQRAPGRFAPHSFPLHGGETPTGLFFHLQVLPVLAASPAPLQASSPWRCPVRRSAAVPPRPPPRSPRNPDCAAVSASIHPLHSPHRPCPKIIVLRSASL